MVDSQLPIRWVEPEPVEVPDALHTLLTVTGDSSSFVAAMLVRRGIRDVHTARGFLDPTAYSPASPWDLPTLDRAVDRLERAIAHGERIAVWGDLDVDGQTATALYAQALRELGANVTYRIPTRRESHGVHSAGVQRLVDQGMKVLLTADTGVAAHDAVALAAGQGVDVLITDHHDLPPALPSALAVVNPKRLPAEHPLHELSGVGVAYQVICALVECLGGDGAESYLDLVALGLVADVATLRQDVRYLVQRGLQILRRTDRIGIKEMVELADLELERLTEDDIRFSVAPRLNAVSRVGDDGSVESAASLGVELLTTGDRTRARTIAVALEALNARRKWLTQQTLDAAMAQLERDRSLLGGPAIVLSGANWEPGIVGVVAGRLVERFGKPTIVFSAPAGEVARGSARSVEGVDIHAAIAAHRDMLVNCGGHPMAAGLSIDGQRIAEFRRALWRTLAQTVRPRPERQLAVEEYLELDQLSLSLARAVQQLSPFGPGNQAPVFATRSLSVASSSIIGRTREHRRVVVTDADQRQETVLWWQGADQAVPEGAFDLAYTIGTSAFRGEETLQLTWVAARPLGAVTVRARPEAVRTVRDFRIGDRDAAYRTLVALTQARRPDSVMVWAEGERLADMPACNRRGLAHAETLVVWTAPPDPDVLAEALETASPSEVVLFGLDPGLDSLAAFLPRLVGLLKHALRQRGGSVLLSDLAAAMAHAEMTVRLGLEWIAEQGQLQTSVDRRGQVTVRDGRKAAPAEEAQADRWRMVEQHLQAQLREAAAYRSYFRRADGQRLVNG